MPRREFTKPPDFADGDVLGASQINLLIDNQEWLREITGGNVAQRTIKTMSMTDVTEEVIGYWRVIHAGGSNRVRLLAKFQNGGGGTMHVLLYYKDMTTPLISVSCASGATTNINRTASILEWPTVATHPGPGEAVLVKVVVTGDGSNNAILTIYCIREEIPSVNYVSPPNFTDGDIVYAWQVDRLALNQNAFRPCASPRPAFIPADMYGEWMGMPDRKEIGRWWVRHNGDTDYLHIIGAEKRDRSGRFYLDVYYKNVNWLGSDTPVKTLTFSGAVTGNWHVFDELINIASWPTGAHPASGEEPVEIVIVQRNDTCKGRTRILWIAEELSDA